MPDGSASCLNFITSTYLVALPYSSSLRHYIGLLREESLITDLETRLGSIKAHDFTISSLEPYQKDGGVFIQFSYSASDPQTALQTIEAQLKHEADKHGGLPSWLGLTGGQIWLVKGAPWREACYSCN